MSRGLERIRQTPFAKRQLTRGERVVADRLTVPKCDAVRIEADLDRLDSRNMAVQHKVEVEVYLVKGRKRNLVAKFAWENKEPLDVDAPLPGVRLPSRMLDGGSVEVELLTKESCQCGVNVEFE